MQKTISHYLATCFATAIFIAAPVNASFAQEQEKAKKQEQYSAVAIMYHHFGDDRYPSTNIRLEQFDAHIEYLEKNQFNVWPLDKIIHHLKNGQPVPDKTIAITIDDAYLSVYAHAYPRLKQRNWPFTVFVSTNYIDKKYSNYMNWDQMREMEWHGARFGNHSTSHEHLVRRHNNENSQQWHQRVSADIKHAQTRLNEELKKSVKLFAYPYGEYSMALANVVAELDFIGLGQHSGAIGTHSDFRFLPRFPFAESFGAIEDFSTKVLSLAMPIAHVSPIEPMTEALRPTLKIELADSDIQATQISCYISGQGRGEVQWLNKQTFQVQANHDLPPGRSRYNCTAPSDDSERFYWFSQPWIRPGGKEYED